MKEQYERSAESTELERWKEDLKQKRSLYKPINGVELD